MTQEPPPEMNQPEAAGTEQRVSEAAKRQKDYVEHGARQMMRRVQLAQKLAEIEWGGRHTLETCMTDGKIRMLEMARVAMEFCAIDASQPASATPDKPRLMIDEISVALNLGLSGFQRGQLIEILSRHFATSPEAQSLPADAGEALLVARSYIASPEGINADERAIRVRHKENALYLIDAALTSAKPASTSGEAEGARLWRYKHDHDDWFLLHNGGSEIVLIKGEIAVKEICKWHNATLRNSGSEKALEEIREVLLWLKDHFCGYPITQEKLAIALAALKAASADKEEA